MIRLVFCSIAGLSLIAALAGPAPKVQPVKTAPLAYFDAHCSRCHGYMGSFYGASFGKNLSDSQLQEAVRSMASGPGGAPLSGVDLAAEVAFHRSLVAGSPYLVWTGSTGRKLSGEVTPDAKLSASALGKDVPVTVKDSDWKLTLPDGVAAQSLVLTASLGGKVTKLDLGKAAFSHAKP